MEVGQYIMRSLNLLFLCEKGKKSKKENLKSWNSRSVSLSYTKGDGQGAVIRKATMFLSTYKILSNILLSSLIPYTDDITADHLCWYWHKRSTADHILCLHQTLKKKWE